MEYMKVILVSESVNVPMMYFLEVDSERWERRKIEIFQDGSSGYASDEFEVNGVFRSEGKIPTFEEMEQSVSVKLFPIKISRDEFEIVWEKVTKNLNSFASDK